MDEILENVLDYRQRLGKIKPDFRFAEVQTALASILRLLYGIPKTVYMMLILNISTKLWKIWMIMMMWIPAALNRRNPISGY